MSRPELVITCREVGTVPHLDSLLDALRAGYQTWGYPIVFLGALLENTVLLGLVLPGGTLVLLAAVYAQQGDLSLPLVLLFGWAGMVAGTSLDFLLGRRGVAAAIQRWGPAQRFGPRLDAAERFLERYGAWAFLLAHFIGHVRSFLAITAGAARLPWRRFLLYEGVAALAWNILFIGAGYLAGRNLDRLQWIMTRAGLAIVAALVVAYAVYWLLRRRRDAEAPAA